MIPVKMCLELNTSALLDDSDLASYVYVSDEDEIYDPKFIGNLISTKIKIHQFAQD